MRQPTWVEIKVNLTGDPVENQQPFLTHCELKTWKSLPIPSICNFKIAAQCKGTRFIFCWHLMQSSAGRQKCLCWLGFCGVAVLVTILMMCFVETIKSDSSVHWKWAQCMGNVICYYQAIGVSALHQEVPKFSNSIRDSRWMSRAEYEICN